MLQYLCMSTKENLHEGHRERAVEKFLKSPDIFAEHELLELLLFSFLPRRDTNPIAHRLLRTFGTIDKIFSADEKELESVSGIGKKTAAQLMLLGKIFEAVSARKKTDEPPKYWTSFGLYKQEVIDLFKGVLEEEFILVLLDKKLRKITSLTFEDRRRDSVQAEIPEIANAIALYKPYYTIVCHNHPSGLAQPSPEDDFATVKIHLLCEMHGVSLADHVIVAGEDTYSYRLNNRLSHIQDVADLNSLLTKFKE